MPDAVSDSPVPRPFGRGLNLTSLAATGLEGVGAPSPPEVEGYAIEALLGTGGLGHVWKAVCLADQSTVALKIPHQADPTFAARLHAEAESLRALDHPHVLRCLNHGTLPDGLPWLALEYVHGAPLSVLIPTRGFSWSEALAHFRRIAAAVVHAHSHGVLHRDLKPSNVLIGHDGSLKVADFGLARSVSERVVTFSLTLTGHIAGTAEYLAPECYARDYHPAVAADIYALGVILYELLAGHPPRGAWSPVSQQKEVDIRVDDVLRRALEPDPAQRFATVQAMLDELEIIARTPPRYSGTPRLTRAVRFLDALWTAIGLFLFLGAFGLVVRIEKYGFGLPVDLIGTETIRIGTYQGIVILLACAVPFGLWQILRLWRFRRVPLREALPSPFGLKLGTTRIAALVILLAQLFLVFLPVVFGAYAWRERCCDWLNPSSPPWEQGLVVSFGAHSRMVHDRWAWPEKDKAYFLRERSGWIADPLSKQFDMTSFWPGFMPRCILVMTVWYALVVVITLVSAFTRWWRFRKWGRAVALTALLGVTANAVQAERRARAAEQFKKDSNFNRDGWYMTLHAGSTTKVLSQNLFPHLSPPLWDRPPTEMLDRYAPNVDFGDGKLRSGEDVVVWLSDFAARGRAYRRGAESLTSAFHGGDWTQKKFRHLTYYFDFTDPPDGPSTGALTVLILNGDIDQELKSKANFQDIKTLPLWSVPRPPLDPQTASAWAKSLLAALHSDSGPTGADKLRDLFFPHLLRFKEYTVPFEFLPREPFLDSLLAQCAAGSRPRLLHPPGPAVPAPGGRQQLVLTIEDRRQLASWTVDLIFAEGRWQCVKMAF